MTWLWMTWLIGDSMIWVRPNLLLDDSDSIKARAVPRLPGGWLAAVRLDVGRSGEGRDMFHDTNWQKVTRSIIPGLIFFHFG